MLFILNSGAQFVRPAVSAMIPGITEKEDLSTANSLFSLSASVNQVAGYGIGGVIVLALGVVVPFYYDSLTFLFAAAMLSLSRLVCTSGSTRKFHLHRRDVPTLRRLDCCSLRRRVCVLQRLARRELLDWLVSYRDAT
jgi:MFS family permease